MAGYHVLERTTTASNYIAVEGKLTLPATLCDCRLNKYNDGVFPEFFFGVYPNSGDYGLDIGIRYDVGGFGVKSFKMFCSALKNTLANGIYTDKGISLERGQTVLMKVELSGNNVVLKVTDPVSTATLGTLTTALKVDTINKIDVPAILKKGCRITRELKCASNVDNYIPSDTGFSDTFWFDGKVTTTTGTIENITSSNTTCKQYADKDCDGNTVFINAKRCWHTELGLVNGCLRESACCNFRDLNPFDLNNDGIVDDLDLEIVRKYLGAKIGDADWPIKKVADFNSDGIVDALDITAIKENGTFKDPARYDLNLDGVVNGLDLAIAQRYFGAKQGDADWDTVKIADVNEDGVVDMLDLNEIFANYGSVD